MKRFSYIALAGLMLLGACRGPAGSEVALRFQQAQDRFDAASNAEDYALAARDFEAVLTTAPPSAPVLYNLGNAYARADERGRAVAAFRRAQRLRPRDPYLENNLKLALGAAPSLEEEGRDVLDHLFFWRAWLSTTELGWLTGWLATATCVLAIVASLRPRTRWAARLRWLFLALTLAAGASFALKSLEEQPGQFGVIVRDETVARSGNSDSYEPAFTEPLSEAAEFRVLEVRGDWVHLRLPTGPEGWVPAEACVVY